MALILLQSYEDISVLQIFVRRVSVKLDVVSQGNDLFILQRNGIPHDWSEPEFCLVLKKNNYLFVPIVLLGFVEFVHFSWSC